MDVDVTAESNLLCALLTTDQEGIDKVALILNSADFQDREKASLFEAMLWLRNEGRAIDVVGCYQGMETLKVNTDDAARVIANTFNAYPLAGQVERYAQAVKEQSRVSRLRRTIVLANSRLLEGENIKWVKNELVADIEEVETDSRSEEDCVIEQAMEPVLASIYDRMHGDQSRSGLRTGITELDHITSGINREELWVVGGMPGRGKSAFALQTALNVAGEGAGVYFISLEMSRGSIMRRLLKMKFGAAAVENPGREWERLLAYREDLKTLPLFINDSASLDIEDLVSRTRARISRSKTALVIVDYIQLIRCEGRERRDRVSEATDRLRRLAKDTGTPVLALSQLRRPQNIDDRPSMIDLKESGDIEAHAHVVLLLYMPDDPERRGQDEIIVGKQREGPTGRIEVAFVGEKGRFFERAR